MFDSHQWSLSLVSNVLFQFSEYYPRNNISLPITRLQPWSSFDSCSSGKVSCFIIKYAGWTKCCTVIGYLRRQEWTMNLWLIITVIHTTQAVVKLEPEKNSGLKGGFEPMTSAIWKIIYLNCGERYEPYIHIFLCSSNIWSCILHILRIYYKLTMWPAPRWLSSYVGRHL